MAKKASKAEPKVEAFGSLQVGAHFKWGQHPDTMEKIEPKEDGPKSPAGAMANVLIVAGPRKGQAYHFAQWEKCRVETESPKGD
jgi:hypothetical protein